MDVADDEAKESGPNAHGSTKRGIAQVASHKYAKDGISVEQLSDDPELVEDMIIAGLKKGRESQQATTKDFITAQDWIREAQKLLPFLTDSTEYIHEAMAS